MSTAAPHRKTLWEEGRHPGRLVAAGAALVVLLVVALDLLVAQHLNLFFDVVFVAVCIAAALAVRPRDFFLVGVLPPLLMAVTVVLLTMLDRAAVARASDGFVQAVVSGLAHHAGALITGYGLTLAILTLRQVALRNAGRLRGGVHPVHFVEEISDEADAVAERDAALDHHAPHAGHEFTGPDYANPRYVDEDADPEDRIAAPHRGIGSL